MGKKKVKETEPKEGKKPLLKKTTWERPYFFRLDVLFSVVSSALTIVVIVFSLMCLHSVLMNTGVSAAYFFLMFFFLSVSRIPQILKYFISEHKKLPAIKNIVFAVLFLGLGVAVLFFPDNATAYCFICSLYFFIVMANRIMICFEKRTIASFIFNGILAALALALGVIPLVEMGTAGALDGTMTLCLVVVTMVALFDTLAFVFSSIRLKGILKIMQKTFAFEILYGLIVLIVACSFFFSIMEDGIPTFWDGMWYSFAVITTIGFGDFTVKGTIGRLLSVILGLYGIVVVAVITSIIVNFYTEAKEEAKEKAALNEASDSAEKPAEEDPATDSAEAAGDEEPTVETEEPKAEPKRVVPARAYYISKQPDGEWQVRLGNSEIIVGVFDSQSEAVAFVKGMVQSQGGSYRIHNIKPDLD